MHPYLTSGLKSTPWVSQLVNRTRLIFFFLVSLPQSSVYNLSLQVLSKIKISFAYIVMGLSDHRQLHANRKQESDQLASKVGVVSSQFVQIKRMQVLKFNPKLSFPTSKARPLWP